ncbi:c-type cytochrome [Caldibacillus lycopersici]|uniref:C-type cytochrome n=1 Tax=Perspicuibacillus lycopersici TaxID=1325689 RepID=A0AAE3IU84_9BACI|nr:menaquinol-cytochrome c reductase cytochrome b/c subunit [Perspicuibacillus lycopersici]MCU9613698.1 c-type cytochrome [Perspicuibacillus lycopersici]
MHRGKGMKFVGDSRIPINGRKPNIPKDYSEYPGKTEAFYPDFLLKEWMVGAVFLAGFLCLTAAEAPPLERIADPTDTTYIPMPDWYFLFLYQLLKYTFTSGPYNILGAMVIPGLAFGSLLLAPFLDRGPERRPFKRPLATGFMLLGIAAVFYLTWQAAAHHDWEAAKRQGEIKEVVEVDKEDPGYKVMEANGCLGCHGGNLEGLTGPQLVGTEKTADEIKDIAVNGFGDMPPGLFKGTDEELQQLADFIKSIEADK